MADVLETSPCDRQEIGESDGPLIGAYTVVDGELGELCFGLADPRLADSWETLTDIAAGEDLAPVAVFAGYRSDGSGSGNIAFAGPLGEDNLDFVVAVDLDEASADLAELRVTMAHEFAHVLTQVPDQLDIELAEAQCETFWNGNWCFARNSYIADWVAEFWTPEQLDSLPLNGEADTTAGEDRCNLDPTFLGSYAASHPEEDFAESFAAFVYNIRVPAEVSARQAFFVRYPELAAYRERAAGSGNQNLPNNFEACG